MTPSIRRRRLLGVETSDRFWPGAKYFAIFRGEQSLPMREERSLRGVSTITGLIGVVCLLKGRLPFQVFAIYEKSVVINKTRDPAPILFASFLKGGLKRCGHELCSKSIVKPSNRVKMV